MDASYPVLAARLLREAAVFFRRIGEEDAAAKQQLHESADVFDQVANLVEEDPQGQAASDEEGNPQRHVVLAARLLRDAATFFRSLAQDNPDIKERLGQNADAYDEMAGLVETEESK